MTFEAMYTPDRQTRPIQTVSYTNDACLCRQLRQFCNEYEREKWLEKCVTRTQPTASKVGRVMELEVCKSYAPLASTLTIYGE